MKMLKMLISYMGHVFGVLNLMWKTLNVAVVSSSKRNSVESKWRNLPLLAFQVYLLLNFKRSQQCLQWCSRQV